MPWFWARVHDRTPRSATCAAASSSSTSALVERHRGARRRGATRRGGRSASAATDGRRLRVTTAAGERARSTRRLDPADAPDLSTRRPTCPPTYRARYDWGQAYGAHCLILALDRPLLKDVYWLNINDPGYPFLAPVEHTNYIPASGLRRPAPGLPRQLPADGSPAASRRPTRRRWREFLPHLSALNPAFDARWVTECWVFNAPFAQPIVTTRLRERTSRRIETPLPGLYLANMFQVYPQDRGQNYSIALANELAKRLLLAR